MLLSKRISRRDTQIAHFGLSSGMNVRDGEIERVSMRARMELLKLFLSNREKPLSFFLYLSVVVILESSAGLRGSLENTTLWERRRQF